MKNIKVLHNLKGTPHDIDEAISRALIAIESEGDHSKRIKITRRILKDFIANRTIHTDEAKSEAYIELFKSIFSDNNKGYLLTLQWNQGVKKLSDFDQKPSDPNAKAVAELIGGQKYLISKDRPRVPIGNVLFRINHDDSLTLIETNYDCND